MTAGGKTEPAETGMNMNVRDYFYNGGLNCSESTMKCLIDEGIIDAPREAIRLMSGFGGGMQRGTTCGAVIGAVAALGWRFGRTEPGEDRSPSAKAVREFLKAFEEKFGALDCRTLRSVYSKEHGLKSEGMYRSCTVFVEYAAEKAREIVSEAGKEQ